MSIHFEGQSLIASEAWHSQAAELSALAMRMHQIRADLETVEKARRPGLKAQLAAMTKERDRLLKAQEALGETPKHSAAFLVAGLVNDLIHRAEAQDKAFLMYSVRFGTDPVKEVSWNMNLVVSSQIWGDFLRVAVQELAASSNLNLKRAIFLLNARVKFLQGRVIRDAASWNSGASLQDQLLHLESQKARAELATASFWDRLAWAQDLIDKDEVVFDELDFDLSLRLHENFIY